MFHLRRETAEVAEVTLDMTRPGVYEYADAAARLKRWRRRRTRTPPPGLREVEERSSPPARACCMTRAVELPDPHGRFLDSPASPEPAWRRGRAFHRARQPARRVEALRVRYQAEGHLARLERLASLLATMDFVTAHDRAAMLLADGEAVEQALATASTAREAGEAGQAAELAATAYRQLLAADMQGAVAALARKLTTRNDFGVLTTVNVKVLPLYWRAVGRLEEYLPAVPRATCRRGATTGRCGSPGRLRRAPTVIGFIAGRPAKHSRPSTAPRCAPTRTCSSTARRRGPRMNTRWRP